MITSHVGPVPAERPQNNGLITDSGAQGSDQGPDQGPMSQQDAADCHGHEMHPQEFVRLVGCHESNMARHHAEDHLH
jgi:hypothetical protein